MCFTPPGPQSKLDKFKLIAGLKFKSKMKSKASGINRNSKRRKFKRHNPFQKAKLKFYNDFEMIKNTYENNSKVLILIVRC